MNNIYSSNFEILTLPVLGGKTTKAIEYAIKEALEKRVIFITFDASDMWLRERFKSKRDEYLEKHSERYLRNRNALVENLRVFTFTHPINGVALDNIIEAEKPEVIVFDGIEYFETKNKVASSLGD